MSAAPAPKNSDGWLAICERELGDARLLSAGHGSNQARIDHLLRATEAVIKGILWKHHAWVEWPPQKKGFKFLYRHDLQELLNQCPDAAKNALRLSPGHRASWDVLLSASRLKVRYIPDNVSDTEALSVARAAL